MVTKKKKKPIVLDKRGVKTKPGQKSSEVGKKKTTKQFTGAKTKKEFAAKDARLKREKERRSAGISRREGNIEERKLASQEPKAKEKQPPIKLQSEEEIRRITEENKAIKERSEKVIKGVKIGAAIGSLAIGGGAAAVAVRGGLGVVKAFRAASAGGFVRPAGTKIVPGFTQRGFTRATTQLGKLDKAGVLSLLKSKPVQFVGKNLGTIALTSGIMTWLASDNIMSGASIFARDVAGAVDRGDVPRIKGLELIEEQQELVDTARSFVNVATMVNPLMWPFRNIVMTNAEGAQNAIGLHRQRIESAPTAEERQAEASEAFNVAVDEGRSRRREEDLADQAEDTLFFEAIRKRNKGQELTPEEEEALIARGASTE